MMFFPPFSLFILLKCQVFKKTNRKVVLQPITLKHRKKEEKPFIHLSLQRSFILFMMIICRLNTAPPFTLCFIRCCRNVWTGTWGRFIFAWFQKTITLSNLAVRLQLMLNAECSSYITLAPTSSFAGFLSPRFDFKILESVAHPCWFALSSQTDRSPLSRIKTSLWFWPLVFCFFCCFF